MRRAKIRIVRGGACTAQFNETKRVETYLIIESKPVSSVVVWDAKVERHSLAGRNGNRSVQRMSRQHLCQVKIPVALDVLGKARFSPRRSVELLVPERSRLRVNRDVGGHSGVQSNVQVRDQDIILSLDIKHSVTMGKTSVL